MVVKPENLFTAKGTEERIQCCSLRHRVSRFHESRREVLSRFKLLSGAITRAQKEEKSFDMKMSSELLMTFAFSVLAFFALHGNGSFFPSRHVNPRLLFSSFVRQSRRRRADEGAVKLPGDASKDAE